MLGVPHAWPSPDPIVQDMQTYKIAAEQPYIYRLTYLGVEAERRGKGLAFAHQVSNLIFSGTRDWHLGEHLAQAAQRAGLDLASMDAAIADPASHRATVEENQEALTKAGHWGVPTFVFEGEPFFGEDRVDTLRWRLGKSKLQRN
jgi:2-hydroxychromene-2-carboxylate isomerase